MMSPRLHLLGALAIAIAPLTATAAEYAPFAVGGLDLSRDSDNFRVENYNLGGGVFTMPDNTIDRIGYRRSETHFSSPGFSTHGSADSLFAARHLTEFGNFDVSGELTRARLDTGEDDWLGWAQFSGQPGTASNVELRYERNWVDSRNSLLDGITYSAVTAAGDYQLTERLNLAGVIGHFNFSDGNERPLYRIKGSWVLSETYGISLYARARHYTDSDPDNGYYFTPERFHDWLTGISLRRRLPVIRGTLSAHADWGRQSADGDRTPARTWQVRMESWVGTRWSYAIATGYNSTAGTGGGDDYEYRYTSASVTLAF